MRDYRKGKRCMVWSFMGNTRMYQALNQYGDRFDTVGIFTFEVDASGTISETGTSVSGIMPYITKWPHIKWMLTVMNHGYPSVFTALRNNTNGAKTRFLSELVRIMGKYPWCAGVDIDLEQGGGYENREAANALFRDIYSTVKGYSSAKLVNICLPGMTGVQGSVGGENWCVYADLNAYCDTAAIMSYGMAWAGSAPGPVSPRSWLEGIYSYATRVMSPDKVFLGMPTYGWEWQIFDTPENQGKAYRGTSRTYYAAEIWMNGGYHYADRQQYIPFFAYWDDYDKVPWLMPFVYDFMDGHDNTSTSGPISRDAYNRRRYLTCYGKEQSTSFGTVYIDRNGQPDSYTGNMVVGETSCAVAANSTATFNFAVPSTGVYDVAVCIGFPFWDKNGITMALDGTTVAFNESRLRWPGTRTFEISRLYRISTGQHSPARGVCGAPMIGAPAGRIASLKVRANLRGSTTGSPTFMCGRASLFLRAAPAGPGCSLATCSVASTSATSVWSSTRAAPSSAVGRASIHEPRMRTSAATPICTSWRCESEEIA